MSHPSSEAVDRHISNSGIFGSLPLKVTENWLCSITSANEPGQLLKCTLHWTCTKIRLCI